MSHTCDPYFPCTHTKQHQQEMDIYKMAAPNAEPAGKVPGPKAANTHAPHQAGKPANASDAGGKSGPGQGRANPIKPGHTGPNKNRLH